MSRQFDINYLETSSKFKGILQRSVINVLLFTFFNNKLTKKYEQSFTDPIKFRPCFLFSTTRTVSKRKSKRNRSQRENKNIIREGRKWKGSDNHLREKPRNNSETGRNNEEHICINNITASITNRAKQCTVTCDKQCW